MHVFPDLFAVLQICAVFGRVIRYFTMASVETRTKGAILSSDAKEVARNVIAFCEEEAKATLMIHPISCPMDRARALTRIPRRTLQRIKAKGTIKSSTNRKTRADKVVLDEFDTCVVRRTVHSMYTEKKCLPTLNTIHAELAANINFKAGKSVLRRILKGIGFQWKKCCSNRQLLMERSDVVTLRINYLREIRGYRNAGRPIVYMDETYVNSSHTVPRCWQADNIGMKIPYSKGERLIVVHAGSEKGFVPGAKLVFKAHCASGDYHGEMNANNFRKWLEDQLIPNLEPGTVLVIDNAPYHNVQEDRKPTTSTRKKDIQDWLSRHNVPFSDKMIRPQLLELCKQKQLPPTFKIDVLMHAHGHTVLRLPPYHADLNPIELIWADVKGSIAKENLQFKMKEVLKLTNKSLDSVTEIQWKKCVDHVKSIELSYWKSDIAVDEAIERIVISLEDTDSETTATAAESEDDGQWTDSTLSGNDSTDSIDESTDTADEMFSVVSFI